MTRAFAYWDYDANEVLRCGQCGWSGRAGDYQDLFREVMSVSCQSCDTMLLVVQYPTLAETEAAAQAGVPRAAEELAELNAARTRVKEPVRYLTDFTKHGKPLFLFRLRGVSDPGRPEALVDGKWKLSPTACDFFFGDEIGIELTRDEALQVAASWGYADAVDAEDE